MGQSTIVSAARAVSTAVTIFALLSSLGCARAHYVRADQPTIRPAGLDSGAAAEHLILISVDGLRPDAIAAFGAVTLSRLIQEGSYTLTASTILPSKTLPSHTSMLTGEFPETHGVMRNAEKMFGGAIQTPTVFGVLRSKGLKTAAFFSKSKFHDLQQPGTLDYSQAPGGWLGGLIPGRWTADRTILDVEEYLENDRPNLLFVHFGDADYAGHRSGWMTPSYAEAVRRVDGSIGRLLSTADRVYGAGEYTVIVTADHGGRGRDHGSDNPLDVTIPWIAWGTRINPGPIAGKVETVDTASTVLWLFGVPEPTEWAGDPVTAAFQSVSAKNQN
jgi:arylsulfatase A-like enzyme